MFVIAADRNRVALLLLPTIATTGVLLSAR
jgi:hypothetical protein